MDARERIEYIKEEVLGKGSFGDVYAVTDKRTAGRYAMKIVPGVFTIQRQEARDALTREIAICKTLNHPNIVRYVNSFLAQDQGTTIVEDVSSSNPALVIELCAGSLLAEFKLSYLCFPTKVLKKYLLDIIKGMIYLKTMKVIHRDLSMSNILVVGDQAKISDFGSAVFADQPMDELPMHYLTAPESIDMGTYSYATDLWAYGIIHFSLLFETTPFGTHDTFRMGDVIRGFYTFPSNFTVSSETRDLFAQIFTIWPDERIQAEDLLNHAYFVDME